MITFRVVARFCRANAYLQRFTELQQEVNRRERELIIKKEEIERIKILKEQTSQDKLQEFLSGFLGKPYETEAVAKEKEQLKKMYKKYEDLQRDGDQRRAISKKLEAEQKIQRQKVFVSDIAKFWLKFQQLPSTVKINQQVKTGLELSVKSLQKILAREGIQFIEGENNKYNSKMHEQHSGQGNIVDKVVVKGFRQNGQVVSKAKVHLRRK